MMVKPRMHLVHGGMRLAHRRPRRGWRLDPRTEMLVPTCLRMGAAGASQGGGGGEGYATWNPSRTHAKWTLSGGNLTLTKNTLGGAVSYATRALSSGKYYWEVDLVSAVVPNQALIGWGTADAALTGMGGSDGYSWCYYGSASKRYNGSFTSWGTGCGTGDIVMLALDLDNGKGWFGKNGTWFESGDPGAGTGEAFSGLSDTMYAGTCSVYPDTDVHVGIFDPASLNYSAPSGFTAGIPSA
jgi:hypothetical protein